MRCYRIGYKYAQRAVRLDVPGMGVDELFEHPELATLITKLLAAKGLTEPDIISIAAAPTTREPRNLEFMIFCREPS